MAVINISDSDFSEKVLQSRIPVLVDFYAIWCGPCKMAEPVLEELSITYAGKVVIAKVNVEESKETSGKYDIMSIPTTILFKGGAEVSRQTGFSGKQVFEELIKKAL